MVAQAGAARLSGNSVHVMLTPADAERVFDTLASGCGKD